MQCQREPIDAIEDDHDGRRSTTMLWQQAQGRIRHAVIRRARGVRCSDDASGSSPRAGTLNAEKALRKPKWLWRKDAHLQGHNLTTKG